ncbi:HAMP domain-containing histidine kinase [Paenibacillus sp. KQZ6P-2]|uniref:histidine kinase n=1 Tax=Paenibacillus mangrovi TaxID=2931978 RepID=A0A9X1WNU1_9BACL|nr:HAMP domain-containing sensor histidine kinase [Paenibacillus mangrovi]MCJ8012309.1 HAMP domain-containing histidine kinase [Paenibacillus mangrovi]
MILLNKFPLRLRLTILTTVVLTTICVLLTTSSVFTAQKMYAVPAEDYNFNTTLSNLSKEPPATDRINNNFTYASVAYMFIMIVLGTAASYFVAGKTLKPVADLTKRIETIDENKLFQRLEGFDTNDEVARLAASFNHMILKLEKSFNHQKQFAANAAHELKTPLAGIIANIEVLQLDKNPSVQEYKEVLDDTLTNAQRLSTLVYDLLKMNNAINADICESFDAKDMFEDIILALSENSKVKNVLIKNNISDIMLFGEKVLLQRAFFNLVQNAVKYNKLNEEVVVTAAQNDDFVTVNIKDNGIGIPEEELESIFEPFYRIDTSRSRELGGSGLGLSIAKTIIEKHNGEILFESEVDVFTKVTVILPKN